MTKYARFGADANHREGTVQEVLHAPVTYGETTFQLEELYTAEFITWLRECPETVEPGWTYEPGTDSWVEPVPPEEEP